MRSVMRRDVQATGRMQCAALPWRRSGKTVEILLITTRNTGRWIVPKGWSLAGLPPHQSAAHEAMEEAGIAGTVDSQALGSFSYTKVRKNGEMVTCRVAVYSLRVERQARNWPEKGVRELRWCSVGEAMERIREPGLRRIISRFAVPEGAVALRRVQAVPRRTAHIP